MLKFLRSTARDVAGMFVAKENVLCGMWKPHQRKQVLMSDFEIWNLFSKYQICLYIHIENETECRMWKHQKKHVLISDFDKYQRVLMLVAFIFYINVKTSLIYFLYNIRITNYIIFVQQCIDCFTIVMFKFLLFQVCLKYG